jgi:hypothetical protein
MTVVTYGSPPPLNLTVGSPREQADRAQRIVGEVAALATDGLVDLAHEPPEVLQLDALGLGEGLCFRHPIPLHHHLGVLTGAEAVLLELLDRESGPDVIFGRDKGVKVRFSDGVYRAFFSQA